MKILIVDDVLMVGRQLKHILEREELFQVEVVNRAVEALWKLQHDPSIRVVITDLLMPEMNGLELVNRAKQIKTVADSEITDPPEFLLMTAVDHDTKRISSDKTLLLNAINSNLFADILYKPICRDRLLDSIFELDLDDTLIWETAESESKENPVLLRIQKKIDKLLTTKDFVTLESLEQFMEQNLKNIKTRLNSL